MTLAKHPDASSWAEFADEAPELAVALRARLHNEAMGSLSYFATVRKDGSPRVNPVKVFEHDGRLHLVTGPSTPKHLDLIRDNRFNVHIAVAPKVIETGELSVRGCATRIVNEEIRDAAKAHAPFVAPPPPDWVLLELHLTSVIGVLFSPGPIRWRWSPGSLTTERLGGPMADGVRKEGGDETVA
jgi:Pyridoxamine 5'-phosphate oxidase